MKLMLFASLAACLIIFGLPSSAASYGFTQASASQETGKLAGMVLDPNDARVAGAKIRIKGTKFKWTGKTDDEGNFSVDVPAGEYRIYVESPGFRKFESSFIKVWSGATETVNIRLELSPPIETLKVLE